MLREIKSLLVNLCLSYILNEYAFDIANVCFYSRCVFFLNTLLANN